MKYYTYDELAVNECIQRSGGNLRVESRKRSPIIHNINPVQKSDEYRLRSPLPILHTYPNITSSDHHLP